MLLKRFCRSLSATIERGAGVKTKQYIGVVFDGKNVEEFEVGWINYFRNEVKDHFDLQRGLTQVFENDIVPTIPILKEALLTCRRVDDYATSVRIFGILRKKCPSEKFYLSYMNFLAPLKEELGTNTPEEIGRH